MPGRGPGGLPACAALTSWATAVTLLCVRVLHCSACACGTAVRARVALLCVRVLHCCACTCCTAVRARVALFCVPVLFLYIPVRPHAALSL